LTGADQCTARASIGCAVLAAFAAFALAGCESFGLRQGVVLGRIDSDMTQASERKAKPAPPAAVNDALLPPLTVEMPSAAKPVEARFDLSVSNAVANQVFMAMVSGTRYSMLVHPDIKEPITISLKDVTLMEALEAMREVYGYEYKIDGTRIYVLPVTIQSRLFHVNYLSGRRVGRADVRVSSGSIQAPVQPTPGLPGAPPTQTMTTPGGSTPATAPLSIESSRVTTSSDHDFWAEIQTAVRTIIGDGGGRSVVVNANAGVIMVRALPKELRSVEQYLKAMALIVERQVMLEAKIIEVSLTDQFATGINWAAFGRNPRFAAGVATPNTVLRTDGSLTTSNLVIDPSVSRPLSPDPLTGLAGTVGSAARNFAVAATAPASIFGLAFQTGDFAALLNFLESQGTVHVLSSPRIATINNQKAVIKVGTDDFFVTSVQSTTVATGNTTTVSPTITTQPFFSGIALDVTPQISEEDLITLHVHPSVSSVTDKTKVIDLGTLGVFQLPLASSTINESDTIVRVQDGTIAAIGGLMRQSQSNARSGLPGTGESRVFSNIFGSRNQQLAKSELVILLKVTVIKGDAAWAAQAREANERIHEMARPVVTERK
jgi:MSHA biogenesis protein MshL